jgi:hypothetical protein
MRLVRLLDSPHQIEREAAQAGLVEFQFSKYLAAFDDLTSEARRSTGMLVRQIDAQWATNLRRELAAPGRARKRRALAIIAATDSTEELQDEIAALLVDPDPFLRIEAIRVLAECDTPRIRQALRDALVDTNPLVQEAAELALARTLVHDWPLRSAEPLGAAAPPANQTLTSTS